MFCWNLISRIGNCIRNVRLFFTSDRISTHATVAFEDSFSLAVIRKFRDENKLRKDELISLTSISLAVSSSVVHSFCNVRRMRFRACCEWQFCCRWLLLSPTLVKDYFQICRLQLWWKTCSRTSFHVIYACAFPIDGRAVLSYVASKTTSSCLKKGRAAVPFTKL